MINRHEHHPGITPVLPGYENSITQVSRRQGTPGDRVLVVAPAENNARFRLLSSSDCRHQSSTGDASHHGATILSGEKRWVTIWWDGSGGESVPAGVREWRTWRGVCEDCGEDGEKAGSCSVVRRVVEARAPAMGSPKAWHASGRARRVAAVRWARVLYRLLYAMSFFAAMYAVLAHFRSAPPIFAAGTFLASISRASIPV